MKIKKTTTSKVIAANRENAKLSSGPRPEGLERTRFNATKLGIFGKTLIFPNEAERARYKRLERELLDELQPRTVMDRLRVKDVVDSEWRRRKLVRLTEKLLAESARFAGLADRLLNTDIDLDSDAELSIPNSLGWISCEELEVELEKGMRHEMKALSQQQKNAQSAITNEGLGRGENGIRVHATLRNPLIMLTPICKQERALRRERDRAAHLVLASKRRKDASG